MRTVVVFCTLLASSARGWPVALGEAAPTNLAMDRRGDVLASIPVRVHRYTGTTDIAKFDRADGHARWRHRLHARGPQHSLGINELVLTGSGDPIGVGTISDTGGESFLVVRLDARSGRERWRSRLEGMERNPYYNEGRAVALDPNGDVVVAGTLQNGAATGQATNAGDFAVAKLDGETGNERWRFTFAGPVVSLGNMGFSSQEADAHVVATDRAGNVVAAGAVYGVGGSSAVAVVKLAGASGQLLWRHDLDIAWRTSAVALDPAGDVLLAVSTTEPHGNDFGVVKLSGSNGDVLWVERETASEGRWQEAVRVLADASGDVFASGMVDDGAGEASGPDGYLFTVVRLDGTTGTPVWKYHTEGTAGGGFASFLRLGAPGLVIAGGSTEGAKTCEDILVVALDATTGALVWSRSFDGTLVARYGCSSDGESPGRGPPIDNDMLGSMVVDARGRVFAGIALINRTSTGVRTFGSIRRLRVSFSPPP